MTGAMTGRFSSSNPILQNIPIKTEDGRAIRRAFIAEENKKIVACDYSQIELRLLAEVANIEPLIKAFKNNVDVHTVIRIYKITSPSNKIYIGQSVNIIKRIKRYLILDCESQRKLYNSLKKYDFQNHMFEVIEICNELD